MPTSIANITWPFVPGSLSTLVEYRVDGTTTWIQPTSPMNPTPTNSYPITITDNVVYDARLTTNGVGCAPRSMTFPFGKTTTTTTSTTTTTTTTISGISFYSNSVTGGDTGTLNIKINGSTVVNTSSTTSATIPGVINGNLITSMLTQTGSGRAHLVVTDITTSTILYDSALVGSPGTVGPFNFTGTTDQYSIVATFAPTTTTTTTSSSTTTTTTT